MNRAFFFLYLHAIISKRHLFSFLRKRAERFGKCIPVIPGRRLSIVILIPWQPFIRYIGCLCSGVPADLNPSFFLFTVDNTHLFQAVHAGHNFLPFLSVIWIDTVKLFQHIVTQPLAEFIIPAKILCHER